MQIQRTRANLFATGSFFAFIGMDIAFINEFKLACNVKSKPPWFGHLFNASVTLR